MGNEFTEEKGPKEIEPVEYSDDYVKYCIISQKGEERSLDDSFLSLPDLTTPEEAKKRINFSLFGVFDGHNDKYVAEYLSKNCEEIFKKESGEINKDNCQDMIEKIFKTIDKNLREEKNNKLKNEENKEEEKYISDYIDDKEIDFYKKLIKDSKEIPDDLKNVEDSQIKNLLLFRNLFKYNNNYLYSNNDPDYIGSSASIIMINNENIFTADLGITKCILFNREGKILNKGIEKENEKEKENELFKFEHVFENKSEKKRIKRFNETIDYEKLKLNIYLPTSRCFGLFKYKADEILKEENQIISCVPKVNFYPKDDVDYILLMTKGMINLLKGKLNEFIKLIVEKFGKRDIKISEEIKKYINKRLEEKEKEGDDKEKNKEDKKPIVAAKNNPIYVGKEDFGEENEIINELKKNYYKDIMEMNKNSSHNCHDKYNITCIVMEISKNKKPVIEEKVEEKEKKPEIEKKEIKEVKEENEKKVENDKKEEEEKLEGKDIKENIEKEDEKENKEEKEKNEENKNEIKELPAKEEKPEEKKANNEEEKDKVKEEVEEKKEENKEENKDEKKDEKKEIKLENKEEKNENKEIENINDENKEENKEVEKKEEKDDKIENEDKNINEEKKKEENK